MNGRNEIGQMRERRLRARVRGSALIVVLWVVGLLSMLVASLTFDAHIEARITSYYRKRTRAESLALSGIQIAEMLMRKTTRISGEPELDTEEDDRWYDAARSLKKGAMRGLEEPLGDGTIALEIIPEPARRNVNNLNLKKNDVTKEEDLRELEMNLEQILDVGGITEDLEMWPILIDSFIDWIDKDDVPRLDGAETEDHYGTLDPPYEAKNNPLDTVGELLLVRGYDRSIVYGGRLTEGFEGEEPLAVQGIESLLTTYGDDGKVNVNAASPEVLMTLPGMDEEQLGYILDEREGWVDQEGDPVDTSFESIDDLYVRIPYLDTSLKKYLTTDSKIYRITSVGIVQRVRKKVWCVGKFAGGKLTILRWREED